MIEFHHRRQRTKTRFFSAQQETRALPRYLSLMCAVFLLVAGPIILKTALAQPATVYPSPKTYLESHLDVERAPRAVKQGGPLRRFARSLGVVPAAPPQELVDTGQYIYVKYTVADKNHTPEAATFKSLFADPKTAGEAICAQYETLANVYDTGAGSNYVAFLDNCKITHAATPLDFQFAEANLDGKSVPGVEYDAATGIVYLPKTLYQEGDGETFRPFSAQLLLETDIDSRDQTSVMVHMTSDYLGVVPLKGDYELHADPLDCSLSIPVVDKSSAAHLNLSNFHVYLGDSERPLELINQQNASYDPKTGELTLLVSPLTLATLRINIVPSSFGTRVVDAISLPTPAFAANADQLGMWPYGKFDSLDLQKLKVGQVFSYKSHVKYDANADQFSNIPWAHSSVMHTLQYIYSSFDNRPGDESVGSSNWIFRQLKEGATWEQLAPYIASQPVSSHMRDLNFLFSLPGDGIANKDGTWNTLLDGQNFHGLTSPCSDMDGVQSTYINAPAFCTHIKQPANKLGNIDEKDGRWGTTTMHILKIQLEGNNPYVLIGFCTPQVTTQSGIAVIKFGIWSQGTLELSKVSSAPELTSHNAAYSLKGAVFELLAADKNTHVATLTTNEAGIAHKSGLVQGTYYLKELSSPMGYKPNNTLIEVNISARKTTKISFPNIPLTDTFWPLVQKLDSDMGPSAQGSATLAGAKFRVRLFGNLDGTTSDQPLKTWIFKSDDQGLVRADKNHWVEGDSLFELEGKTVLPLGTYTIEETAAPLGYQLDSPILYKAVLTAVNGASTWQNLQSWNVEQARETSGRGITNKIIRGGVEIEKLDSEGRANRGAATIEGTCFTIRYTGDKPISVGGITYKAGDTVLTIAAKKLNEAAHTRYIATTSDDALPVGTYELSESQSGTGYISQQTPQNFSITGPHKQHLVLTAATNQVIRGGFSLNKVTENMQPLAGIPFLITSTDDADGDGVFERHLLVTDANGIIDTSLLKPTNANDAALIDSDGTLSVDEKNLNPQEGIWFCGRTDEPCTPNPKLAPLPFGTYHVQELSCQANQGMKLVDFDLHINTANTLVNRGTVIDAPGPWLSSLLTCADTQSKLVSQASSTLTDKIYYENLTPNTTYTLVGTLYDAKSGKPALSQAGELLSTRVEFTAKHAAGTISMNFTLDSPLAPGTSLVATQKLYQQDKLVTEHTNLQDLDQTVHTPTLSTHAQTARHTSPNKITLTDTLEYQNLLPNEPYRVITTFFDLDTQALLAQDEKPLTFTSEFVPHTASGTHPLTFEIDAATVKGHRLVIFEELSWQNHVLLAHADKNDAAQTLSFPELQSEFGMRDDSGGLNHYITTGEPSVDSAVETLELTDVVSYSGLTPGETYTLKGSLRNKYSEDAVTTSEGDPLTSESSFTAEESVGTFEQAFTLPVETLKNSEALVAFEELYATDGSLVAQDCDCNHESQSIWLPSLKTHLTEPGFADGLCFTAPNTSELVDTLTFSGLNPNQTYEIESSLIDAQSGDALPFTNDQDSQTTTFMTEQSSGTVDVKLEIESKLLAGKVIVATEKLYQNGTLVAEHSDLKDQLQTVKSPTIQTELLAASTTGHTMRPHDTPKLTDTVWYSNLISGNTYTLKSLLVDKNTGQELASGQQDFMAQDSEGSVDVTFDLQTIPNAGTEVVAIEKLYLQDHLIATHEDLSDPKQTVRVEPESPRERTPRTGDGVQAAALIGLTGASALLLWRNLKLSDSDERLDGLS